MAQSSSPGGFTAWPSWMKYPVTPRPTPASSPGSGPSPTIFRKRLISLQAQSTDGSDLCLAVDAKTSPQRLTASIVTPSGVTEAPTE